jgi:hypothetical protein
MASQKIPFYGKLRLKGEVAESEAKVFGEKYRTLERDVIAKAKSVREWVTLLATLLL